MKQVIRELYWAAISDLDQIKKTKLNISERIALEKALARLDAIRRMLDVTNFN